MQFGLVLFSSQPPVRILWFVLTFKIKTRFIIWAKDGFSLRPHVVHLTPLSLWFPMLFSILEYNYKLQPFVTILLLVFALISFNAFDPPGFSFYFWCCFGIISEVKSASLRRLLKYFSRYIWGSSLVWVYSLHNMLHHFIMVAAAFSTYQRVSVWSTFVLLY